ASPPEPAYARMPNPDNHVRNLPAPPVLKPYSLISKYNHMEKRMKRTILFIIAICLCQGPVFNNYAQARGNHSKPQQNAGRPKKPAKRTSQAQNALASGRPLDAVAWSAARRFAETPFGKIAYVERGSGDAALFLHGFPLNGFQWRGALDRLSAYR